MFAYGNRQRSMHCREFPISGGGFSFGGAASSKPATGGLSITPLGGGTFSLSVALSVKVGRVFVCVFQTPAHHGPSSLFFFLINNINRNYPYFLIVGRGTLL